MAALSADTPGSNAESNAAKLSAPKDKTCPYCGVQFTSSSLGRHLDLYIKEKNPKPPDGVHNVEEIRKVRGGITRRQARGSAARREGSTPGSVAKFPVYDQPSQILGYDTAFGTPDGRIPVKINEASWHTTGVINGLPSRGSVAPASLTREPSIPRHQQLKADYEQRQKQMEEKEHGRAAELALQEVLNSIKAATSRRQETKPLFDFNPYSMSFPALCLRVLPAPPTLFSATPFAHTESWTVDPPGQEQFESLIQTVHDLIRQKRTPYSQLPNDRDIHQILENDPESRKILDHIEHAYSHWQSLSKQQCSEAWSLETLRAFSQIRDTLTETAVSLEQACKELEHLRAENDKLSRCQQPREFIIRPPTLLPISSEAAKAVSANASTPDESKALFDFDHLMDKWKRVVRESRRGMEAQRTFAESPSRQQPPTPFGHQPPTPSPQQQPPSQGMSNLQQSNSNGFGVQYLQPSPHAHPNGAGANGTSHASTPNTLMTSPQPGILDGHADGAGAGDTTMEDEVDEDEDRDADGDADVDIESTNGPNGETRQQGWNGTQQQQHNLSNSTGENGPPELDRRFLDPKLERATSAEAQGMEGIGGPHFMEP